jgi:hypothetical protein
MSTDAAPNDPIEERLQEVVIGEVESQTIVVADYDPVWPERFRQEEAKKEMLGRAAGFRTATCPLGLRSRPSVGVSPGFKLRLSKQLLDRSTVSC